MNAKVVFEVDGSRIAVGMESDTAERRGETTVFHLSYFELWDLIRNLSDIRKEAE